MSIRLNQNQCHRFREEGFLLLRGVLAEPELSSLRDECMAAWSAKKGNFDPTETWLNNSLLVDIHHQSKRARDYYFDGPLVDVAEQLVGANVKAATSQLTFKLRGNTMSFGWHQDNGYGQLDPPTAISTLTALDDADEENGCLWVIPGSHKAGQIDVSSRLSTAAKKAGVDLSVEVSQPEKAIPLAVMAGDAIVLHCHVLHRSEGNRSPTRDRRILFMRYADADAVETYNNNQPRLGRLLRGSTRFSEVEAFEKDV